MPFSRDTRAVVYQRAKMVLDKRPFGTQEDVYREGYEWMHHSVAPKAALRRIISRHHRRAGLRKTLFGFSLQHFGVDFAFEKEDILLVGRESTGVPDDVRAACTHSVFIPMI